MYICIYIYIYIYVVCIYLGVPRGPCHNQLQFSTIPHDLLTCLRRRPLVAGQTPGQRDALAALQSRVDRLTSPLLANWATAPTARNTAFLTGQSDHTVRLCTLFFLGGAIFETRRLQQNAVTGFWGGDF